MIKRKNIECGDSKYLILNPDFSDQLLLTLNQIDDLDDQLEFDKKDQIVTFNQKFTKTEPQSGTSFVIANNNLAIFK